MRIAALADDLTGALEAGARFACHNLAACVSIGPAACGGVQVIDTETRHLPSHEAAASIRRLTLHLLHSGTELIYKKTDSTLRGNIKAELEALSRAAGATVFYVPAYPALGRTVRDGKLYVQGVPVHETAFARDRLNPIASSEIGSYVSGDVEVFDGETDDQVLSAARRILAQPPPRLAAGPAALAGALAELLGTPSASISWPVVGSALFVNGSLHPMAVEQAQAAIDARLPGWARFDAVIGGEGLERAVSLGREVVEILDECSPGALIIFGGDTAWGIWKALGFPIIHPIGEILPGVAVSRIDRDPQPLWLITKAGGFGERDLLCRLHDFIRR